jgi:hypothetical protein
LGYGDAETVTDATAAGVTVMGSGGDTFPSEVAVMFAVPGFTAVMMPVASTRATAVSLDP